MRRPRSAPTVVLRPGTDSLPFESAPALLTGRASRSLMHFSLRPGPKAAVLLDICLSFSRGIPKICHTADAPSLPSIVRCLACRVQVPSPSDPRPGDLLTDRGSDVAFTDSFLNDAPVRYPPECAGAPDSDGVPCDYRQERKSIRGQVKSTVRASCCVANSGQTRSLPPARELGTAEKSPCEEP